MKRFKMQLTQRGVEHDLVIVKNKDYFYIEVPRNYLVLNEKELKELKKLINDVLKDKGDKNE